MGTEIAKKIILKFSEISILFSFSASLPSMLKFLSSFFGKPTTYDHLKKALSSTSKGLLKFRKWRKKYDIFYKPRETEEGSAGEVMRDMMAQVETFQF